MKIFFLIPPSEGKNKGGEELKASLYFDFEKPYDIAINATEKDLKCKGARFEEGINLNKNVDGGYFCKAIERYTGVMYNAIDYTGMNDDGKKFFEDNFLILSGMYGLIRPNDIIGDYKLPIETKGLYKFWGDKITEKLNELNPDFIVNLLPGSYAKIIDFKSLSSKVVNINFLIEKNGKIVKMAHGVKKVKGEWVKEVCEKGEFDIRNFGEGIKENNGSFEIDII